MKTNETQSTQQLLTEELLNKIQLARGKLREQLIKQQRMLNVLFDTVEYYDLHPERRAMQSISKKHQTCTLFDPETGNRCAVGRYLHPAKEELALQFGGGAISLHNYAIDYFGADSGIDALLLAHVQELPLDFWVSLQSYHDAAQFWHVNIAEESRIQRHAHVLVMLHKILDGTYLR